jgi:hypothetical protein
MPIHEIVHEPNPRQAEEPDSVHCQCRGVQEEEEEEGENGELSKIENKFVLSLPLRTHFDAHWPAFPRQLRSAPFLPLWLGGASP